MIKTTSIVITLILAVLLIYLYPGHAINPGELSKGHLYLKNDCMKCHSSFLGTPGEKCIVCHEAADIGRLKTSGLKIDARSGKSKRVFHQLFSKDSCLSCHTDHSGRDVNKTIGKFAHNLLQRDNLNQCVSCHKKPAGNIHQKNNQECSQCHTTDRWHPATLDHAQYFRFDKEHGPDCASCHQSSIYKEYTCYGCHEHSPGKIRGEHFEEGIRNYQQCVSCHPSADEDEAKRIYRSGRHKDSSWRTTDSGMYNRREAYRKSGHDDSDSDDD